MSLSHITIPAFCLIPLYGYKTANKPASSVTYTYSSFSPNSSFRLLRIKVSASFSLYPRNLLSLWFLPLSNQEGQETASTSSLKSEYFLPTGNMQSTLAREKNNRCVIWVSPLTEVSLTLPPPREWHGSAFSPLVFVILNWKLHMA